MKKTLRKKFIIFAMSAVTVLLVVLIGAINCFSWIILDRQSDDILHAISGGGDKPFQSQPGERGPFMPPMNMDTVQAARSFMVRVNNNGEIIDVNVDRIASVTSEQAAEYARQVDEQTGKIDSFKYEEKRLGEERLIFFVDTSGQMGTFLMVLSISAAIGLVCWMVVLIFVIILSGRAVDPILAAMEKQKQFITNAGHELKTPLAIIQSNNDAATLIYGESKYSRNIRTQIQRLNVMMTNLLTLAKLDEGAKLPAEQVDIGDMICDMLPAFEDEAEQKEIVLIKDIRPNVYLQVHRDTFSQMISILLDNAIKYTPEGGIISIGVKTDNGHITVTEENTCEIHNKIEAERLFERFYRGDRARTQSDASGGFGIGLSAARAIAETFGGSLNAEYTADDKIRFTARF
ncbi:MAG: sensor histidine kinase [Emergencia sp.]